MKFYHRSNKENIENILKNGLLKDKATSLKCIYLSIIPNTDFGEALFEINTDKKCYELSEWEHICFDDISPSEITFLESKS
jgi:hypothetical protein